MTRTFHDSPRFPTGLARLARDTPAVTFEQRRRRVGILFVAPALAVLIAILGYPIVESFILALNRVEFRTGVAVRSWVGLGNFSALLSDHNFEHAVVNTVYYTVVEVVVVVAAGLLVAVLLNHPMGRPAFFRVLLIIPWAIAPVANAVLWKWILNANYGALNALLKALGLISHYHVWLGSPFMALNFMLLVDIWKSIPFVALLLFAGLRRVPVGLRRAAYVDGASSLQTFIHITLPSIRQAIAIAVILQTIWALQVFDLVFVLTRGGPADGTVLVNFLAYRVTFNFLELGYGAALANVVFILAFMLAIAYIWLLRPGLADAAK